MLKCAICGRAFELTDVLTILPDRHDTCAKNVTRMHAELVKLVGRYHDALNRVCSLFWRSNEDMSCFDTAFGAMAQGLDVLGAVGGAGGLGVTVAFSDIVRSKQDAVVLAFDGQRKELENDYEYLYDADKPVLQAGDVVCWNEHTDDWEDLAAEHHGKPMTDFDHHVIFARRKAGPK